MPGIVFTLVILSGLALNAHNTGGVASAAELKADTIAAIRTAQPVDYSKMND